MRASTGRTLFLSLFGEAASHPSIEGGGGKLMPGLVSGEGTIVSLKVRGVKFVTYFPTMIKFHLIGKQV